MSTDQHVELDPLAELNQLRALRAEHDNQVAQLNDRITGLEALTAIEEHQRAVAQRSANARQHYEEAVAAFQAKTEAAEQAVAQWRELAKTVTAETSAAAEVVAEQQAAWSLLRNAADVLNRTEPSNGHAPGRPFSPFEVDNASPERGLLHCAVKLDQTLAQKLNALRGTSATQFSMGR